ncbi:MAG TPA: hypothetical protein VFZ34_06795 [Blastocatellia bacterium]|nr:hypothetical protein [Blastocatellia bacterium]
MRRGKRQWLRWSLALLGIALLLVVLGGWLLPKWLIASPPVSSADVILHFPNEGSPLADAYSVELYRQKIAPKIVCISKPAVCELYSADYARQRLIALGIPAEDVLTLHLPFAHCVAPHFPHIVAMAKANNWQRAIMVVRAPFTRSDGALAARHFGQAGLQVVVTSAPQDRERFAGRWWTDHKTAQLIIQAAITAPLDPLYPECR